MGRSLQSISISHFRLPRERRILQVHLRPEIPNGLLEQRQRQSCRRLGKSDEILRYQIARYISTNEGFWRMLQFPIHDHFPAVEQLQVYLENGQRTLFNVENAPDRAAEPPATTLTGFFQLCASDDFSKTLLYIDVPRYYRWVKKKWQRRIQGHLVPETDGIRKSINNFRAHLHDSSQKHRMLSFATSFASRSRTDVFCRLTNSRWHRF